MVMALAMVIVVIVIVIVIVVVVGMLTVVVQTPAALVVMVRQNVRRNVLCRCQSPTTEDIFRVLCSAHQ